MPLNILINVRRYLSQDLQLDLSSQRTMNLFGGTNELEANCNFYKTFAFIYIRHGLELFALQEILIK